MSRRTILRCGCLQVQGEHRPVDGDAVAARRLCDLLVLYSDRSRAVDISGSGSRVMELRAVT
uniref:hypothetical protein n=1 Tax=Rhodococcus qingshengii TaxID=334542 RepID=UPI001C4E2CD6|nr:hypothetical protein [Rhodococcus qingshengii]